MVLSSQRQKQAVSDFLHLCSQLAVLDSLSPDQKAELIMDPDSGALENVTIITEVFTSLTESTNVEQLTRFCQAFAEFNRQVNA